MLLLVRFTSLKKSFSDTNITCALAIAAKNINTGVDSCKISGAISPLKTWNCQPKNDKVFVYQLERYHITISSLKLFRK